MKRKNLSYLLLGLIAVLAITTLVLWGQLKVTQGHNLQIRSILSGGEYIPAESLNLSVPEVLLAYAYQQRQFNLYDEAIETYSMAERYATKEQRVWVYYNLGNLYLSQAVSLAQDLKVAPATAMADVSKDFYRTALRLDPDFYDAKYNYEAAQRLSRDLPLGNVIISEESDDGVSEFWSSMPGFPIGLP